MVLLETLSPKERAVFLLREVFEHEYAEIAAMLETTPANCRQLFHRAKAHIADKRPRFRDSGDEEDKRRLARRFVTVRVANATTATLKESPYTTSRDYVTSERASPLS